MIDRILFSIAIAFLAAFLGILAWRVGRLDLTAVIVATLALAVTDLITTTGKRRDRA